MWSGVVATLCVWSVDCFGRLRLRADLAMTIKRSGFGYAMTKKGVGCADSAVLLRRVRQASPTTLRSSWL